MDTPIDTTTAPTPSQGDASTQPTLTGKRANWTIAHKLDFAAMTITWQVKGAGALTLDVSKVNQVNKERAMLHGFVQRISDAAAMARDSKTGASATPQEKFAAMQRLVEHYQSGSEGWSPARSSEGVGRPKGESANVKLLRAALALYNPQKDAETIEKFVKGLTGAQQTALLVSEPLKVSVELAREQLMEEEKRASEGVDVEAMLGGL